MLDSQFHPELMLGDHISIVAVHNHGNQQVYQGNKVLQVDSLNQPLVWLDIL